jgi:hypothetical protein
MNSQFLLLSVLLVLCLFISSTWAQNATTSPHAMNYTTASAGNSTDIITPVVNPIMSIIGEIISALSAAFSSGVQSIMDVIQAFLALIAGLFQ